MNRFFSKKCLPIALNTPALPPLMIANHLQELGSGWDLHQNSKIQKVFKFSTYDTALKFVQEVAQLAKLENHHPAILLEYKKVTLMITTLRIKGLSENDFILAAKTDAIFLTFHEKS